MISEEFKYLLLKHSMILIEACDKVIRDWQNKVGQSGKVIRPDNDLLVTIGLMYFKFTSELKKDMDKAEESEKVSECPPEPDGTSASHASETDVSGGE